MFYIYFVFSLIAAIFVYIDSEKHQMPRWWSAIIFFAPITMIYYIIQTRQKKSLIPLTVLVVIFVLVGIGESFLYTRIKNKIIYSSYSATAREILGFADELRYSVEQLNSLTLELEGMNSIDSSPAKINEVLYFINTMKESIKKNDRVVKKFLLVVNDYRDILIKEKFDWLIKIEEYYNQPVVIKYLNHLDLYLEAFYSLLQYTGENFQEINSRTPLYIKNYDGYYMNYVRELESHNRIDVVRMQFQHNFLVHYPQLEPYLPTIIKTRFMNIWSKK
ncbi:MAG: hypothetical protein HQK73_04120 [Desulfamplus sp.]|nr:hypothetical protein [Desulfamplus sp.]MBF0412986.1 hypothetical protein [Desulfamplus sp.]